MNAGVTMRGLGFLVLLASLPVASASAASGLDGAERLTLRSVVLDEERTLAVVTPASYARGQLRYPVLYLTDAEAQIGHLRATAEFLARNGLVPDMIVVGIVNTARTRDLTPTRGSAEERGAFPGGGGGERFLDFVEKEVVPAIDARYRTVPLRVLAGHSFGGLLAVHALFNRPELFQAVIAASPSLGWDDKLPLRDVRLARAGEATPRALYVSLGERESSPAGLELFEDFARAAHGVPWKDFRYEWQVIPDEDHGSVVLRSYYAGLRHVFAGWRFPRPAAAAPPPTLAAVREHYRALSERWRITIPPPEGLVNVVGYASLQRGDVDEALEIFRLNVTLHPDSANVHDSLGEGLERAGQLHAALESYRRAVVTAERAGDPLLRTFREHLDAALKRVGAQPRPSSSL